MSDHNSGNNRIDGALDAAVRDIMQLDPRPGLRRRVLSQLTSPVRSSPWKLRLLLPAGALMCVLAAFYARSSEKESPAQVGVSAPASAPASIPPAAVPAPPAAVAAASTRNRIAPSQPPKASRSNDIFGPRTGRATAATVRPVSPTTGTPATGELPYAWRPRPLVVLPGLVVPLLDMPAITPVKKEGGEISNEAV